MIDDYLTSSIDKHPVLWWTLTAVVIAALIAVGFYAVDAALSLEAQGMPRLPKAGV